MRRPAAACLRSAPAGVAIGALAASTMNAPSDRFMPHPASSASRHDVTTDRGGRYRTGEHADPVRDPCRFKRGRRGAIAPAGRLHRHERPHPGSGEGAQERGRKPFRSGGLRFPETKTPAGAGVIYFHNLLLASMTFVIGLFPCVVRFVFIVGTLGGFFIVRMCAFFIRGFIGRMV